jgi:conjugal transfer pilus assembly protein TraW
MKKILLALLILCGNTQATNLGVFGPTYLIKEMDAFEWIVNKRLPELEQAGEIDKMNEKFAKNSRHRIENPKGVYLPQVKIARTRLQSLIYTLPGDIKDAKGRVLFEKGAKINPSNVLPESNKTLLFIDGNSQCQVNYALKEVAANKFIKIVLVSGRPLELMRNAKITIYFDQEQRLINKFKVVLLPTKIYRQKSNLVIEEVEI